MPGQSIGTQFPTSAPKIVFHAEVTIREQDGRYWQVVDVRQPQPPDRPFPIEGELKKFLDDAVKKMNVK